MASDSQQFERALDHWETLNEDGYFSVPYEVGRTAIMCSYFTDIYGYSSENRRIKSAERDVKIFRNETFALADELELRGRQVEVILNAQANDMHAVLADPEIVEVHLIANGNLSSVFMKDEEDDVYDWKDAERHATHLKTGLFVQRYCGHIVRDLSVPLGLFVVDDHRNVLAPVGHRFAPRGLSHPHIWLLRPVVQKPVVTYNDIKSLRYSEISE